LMEVPINQQLSSPSDGSASQNRNWESHRKQWRLA
jgi:hypothetical protein